MNEKVNNLIQIAGIRRYTLTEGKEKGLDVLDCDSGKLRFLLNVGKALDMMQLYHEGQNVSFVSKNGFTARELPFAKRFEGGMLYTCGLDSAGGREGFETHGSLHNTPAKLIRAECNEEEIVVEAETRVSSLFGENLVLKRTVSSKVGSESVAICDVLENRGYQEESYCLLYHCNVGYPMLDEGVTVTGNVIRSEARTEWAREKEYEREVITEPLAGQEETCYFLTFGKPEVEVTNRKIGKKLTLSWSKDTLPHFVEWKSMASGDYALGIEPCTTELDDRFSYRTIRPGEKIAFSLRFTVCKTE